jgi:alpha-tubulin suppressor-like RCC1 family protein
MQKQFSVFKQSVMVLLMFSLLIVLVGCPPTNPPVDTHQVIFELNNGSANIVVEVIDGEEVQMPSQPSKTGHGFIGWFIGDTPYNFNQPVNSDITIRAGWEVINYSFKVLDFKGNIIVDENLPYGTYFKPLIPNAPFMFGFHFVGYNTEANTMIDEDITIEPVYNTVTDFVQSYTFNSKIRKVATNHFSNAVLLENGQLYMWGHNGSPYLLCGGYDQSFNTLTPTEISGQFDLHMNEIIVDIYLGSTGNYAITNQGRFFAWGECFDCNLGLCEEDAAGHPSDVSDYFQIEEEIIKQYFITSNYILIVTESGKVYNSGSYIDKNNLNLDNNKQWVDQTSYFNFAPNEEVIKAVKRYDLGGGLLTTEGRLFVWGDNLSGALGLSADVSKTWIPVDISSSFSLNPNEKIIDFEFGGNFTLILTNQGRVFGAGRNSVGQLGADDSGLVQYGFVDITPNLDLNSSELVINIISNYSANSIFITNQGRALALGSNSFNKLSLSEIEYFSDPIDITNAFGYDEDSYKQWVISSKFIIYVSDYQIAISGNRTFEFVL